MLVLTRRTQESIVIGDGIVITVLDIRGDQIRLGIKAPREVPVYREELLTAVGESNLAAVLTGAAKTAELPAAPVQEAAATNPPLATPGTAFTGGSPSRAA